MKIYLVLCFVVQFSEFLFRGSGLPALLAVTIGSVKLADAQLQVIRVHHVTSLRHIAHEGIFLPL
jgi:hypothetical protein